MNSTNQRNWDKATNYLEKHSRKSDWDHDGNFDDISASKRLFKNDKQYRKILSEATKSEETLRKATLGQDWISSYLKGTDKAVQKDIRKMRW